MKWFVKSFEELLLEELYDLLKLRAEVFVVEQTCVYNDLDDLDKVALHVIGVDNDQIVAYARLLPVETRFKTASIGRVVTDRSARGEGVGKELMERSKEVILKEWNERDITISAQLHLNKFYGDLGFVQASDTYLEDGIPHIKMTYKAQ